MKIHIKLFGLLRFDQNLSMRNIICYTYANRGVNSMMYSIGAHLSIANGYEKAALTAIQIGANTFQFFTRNPRGGAAKVFDADDVNMLEKILSEHHFAPLLAHAPYTINMASDRDDVRGNGVELLKSDLQLLQKLPCKLYNIHPGSRQTATCETGMIRIAACIDEISSGLNDITLLLETMSGSGSEVGGTFEELREIIDRVDPQVHIGVCLDTCHVYCAGYDIVNDTDGVLTEFDKVIGLHRLRAVHLNDSKHPIRSHKDRHEKIGEGTIGTAGFERIINHPALVTLPMFLETPNEISGYANEIMILKNLRQKRE